MEHENFPYSERSEAFEKPNLVMIDKAPEEILTLTIDDIALDEICDLELDDQESGWVDQMRNWRAPGVQTILHSLANRDIQNELPVSEPTFRYQRNIHESKKLQRSVLRLLDMPDHPQEDNRQILKLLIEDASRLLALELRKATWLDQEYNPKIFRRAVSAARGEVNQYLVAMNATGRLDKFTDVVDVPIDLKDELMYLLDGHDSESVGEYAKGRAAIRIPEYFTDRDEWLVYLTTVHELIHAASHQDTERLGLHQKVFSRDSSSENRELNEAVTQLVSFRIFIDHLDKNKTPLERERGQPLDIGSQPYAEYIIVVKQIFSKIPESLFVDAMLTNNGLEALRQKFADVYRDPEALDKYGRKLSKLYEPIAKPSVRSGPKGSPSKRGPSVRRGKK